MMTYTIYVTMTYKIKRCILPVAAHPDPLPVGTFEIQQTSYVKRSEFESFLHSNKTKKQVILPDLHQMGVMLMEWEADNIM